MKSLLFVLAFVILSNHASFAQVILSENFDGVAFPPAGWKTERVWPSASTTVDIWTKQTQAGFFTVFTPFSGNGMAVYKSYSIISDRTADLATSVLDFSDGKSHKVRFRTYRQYPFRAGNDKITVYINTTQTSVNGTALTNIYRSRLNDPSELKTGWIEYEANIPDSFNTNTNYIIFKSTAGYGDDMGLDDVAVESYDCNPPINVTVDNITENSAAINWQSPSSNTPLSYEWEVRFAGTPGSGASGRQQSGTSAGSTVGVTNLKLGQDYSIYLKMQCNAGTNAWSLVKQFKTTAAAGLPIPYYENFDSVMNPTLPAGFKTEDKVKPTDTYYRRWGIQTNTNATSSGENNFGFIVANSSGNVYDSWFFMPAFAFQTSKLYELSFQHLAQLQNGIFEIRLGKFASADSMNKAPVIFSYNNPNQALALRSIRFEVATAGNYYIGFHVKNTSLPADYNTYKIYLDDIGVKEIAASCFLPGNISISAITYNSATFNWNAPASGTPSGYKWELRTSGVPSGGATGLVSSGVLPAGTLLNTINGLQTGTKYTWYIQCVCGAADTSIWSYPIDIQTKCAITALPYVEYFDVLSIPAIPVCSSIIDANNDGKTWITTGYSPPGGSNPNALIYEDPSDNSADDWWFTAGLNMPPGNSYQYYFRYAALYAADSLELRYGNQPDPAHMQKAALVKLKNITNSSYNVARGNFAPQTEGPLYFGFHYISSHKASALYIDNLIITSNGAVSCSPPLDLTAIAVEADSVIVKWKKPATYAAITSYNWEARTDETPGSANAALIASGTFSTTDTVAVIKGMPQNKHFNFYLKSVCSAALSDWAGPIAMTTPCSNLILPYVQNFDQLTAPAIPACMALLDGNNDGALWKTRNNSQENGAANSAPNCMYFFNDNFNQTPSNDWFFLPAFIGASDKTYNLTFSYKSANNYYPEALQVKYGTTPDTASMTAGELFNNNTIKNISYNTFSANFSPSTNGAVYIGFRAYTSSPGAAGLYIDDLQLVALPGSSINNWLGITASWDSPANWSKGTVPDASTDAVINSGVPFTPVVTGTNNITRSLKVNQGATIKVMPGAVLNILKR